MTNVLFDIDLFEVYQCYAYVCLLTKNNVIAQNDSSTCAIIIKIVKLSKK